MSAPPLLFDLAGRGSVVLSGKDRASFLHGLVTNDVNGLRPGLGCAAAFLTAKGKLLATGVVLCEGDRLVLDTAPELSAKVEDLLRKYLVFNDVTIADETAATHVLHLTEEGEGNFAEDFLRRFIGPGEGAPWPQEPHAGCASRFTFKGKSPSPAAPAPAGGEAGRASLLGAAGGGAIRVVRENRTGVPGWDLRVPSSLSEDILAALAAAGARLESPERLEALRILAGIPRWGAELTEAVLPDEAGLRERGFVAENKGCYVGQEIVARIKTYGHVNRRLVQLSVSGGVPAPGDRVFFEGEECGAVTSAAAAGPGAGGSESASAVALAYVRRERAAEGTTLGVLPFAEDPSSPRFLPAVIAPAPLG